LLKIGKMGKTHENKHVCHLFRKKEQMANFVYIDGKKLYVDLVLKINTRYCTIYRSVAQEILDME
jgi:hypothetical protein